MDLENNLSMTIDDYSTNPDKIPSTPSLTIDDMKTDYNIDASITNNLENNISWTQKYMPTTFENCFIKKEHKKMIETWISNLTSSDNAHKSLQQKSQSKSKSKSKSKSLKTSDKPTNSLLIYGSPGIGKTSMATLLLKKYNYDILEFNASETRTRKILQEKLEKIDGSHNIIDFMCHKKTRIAVILDEIDGLSTGDKGGMKEINSIIDCAKDKNTPFICISNSVNKKMDSLKRRSLCIKISEPSKTNLKQVINTISKTENINIEEDTINLIISKSQGDIRRCITLLEYLYRNNKLNKIRLSKDPVDTDIDTDIDIDNNESCLESIESEIEKYSRKITTLAPYEMAEKLLYSNKNYKFYIDSFNYDRNMTVWYLYENCVKYVDKNCLINFDKKLNILENIFDYQVEGDILEKFTFSSQNYEMNNYIYSIKMMSMSLFVNQNIKKSTYNKMGLMNYSSLINKTSQEYSNSKKWMILNNLFNSNQSTNITSFLCDIIYKYIDNDLELIQTMVKKLEITKELFEKIIKTSVYSKNLNIKDLKTKIKLVYNK